MKLPQSDVWELLQGVPELSDQIDRGDKGDLAE